MFGRKYMNVIMRTLEPVCLTLNVLCYIALLWVSCLLIVVGPSDSYLYVNEIFK